MLVSESRNGGDLIVRLPFFRDAMIVLLQLPKGSRNDGEVYLSGDH